MQKLKSCIIFVLFISVLAPTCFGSADTKALVSAKKSFIKLFSSQSLKLLREYDKAIKYWTKKGDLEKALMLKKQKQEFLEGVDVLDLYSYKPFKSKTPGNSFAKRILGSWKHKRSSGILTFHPDGVITTSYDNSKKRRWEHIKRNKFKFIGSRGGEEVTLILRGKTMEFVEQKKKYEKVK